MGWNGFLGGMDGFECKEWLSGWFGSDCIWNFSSWMEPEELGTDGRLVKDTRSDIRGSHFHKDETSEMLLQ